MKIDTLAAEGLIKGGSEKAQFGIKTQKAGFGFFNGSSVVALSGGSGKNWWKCAAGTVAGAAQGFKNGKWVGAIAGAVLGSMVGGCWD